MDIQITKNNLDIKAAMAWAASGNSGCVNIFIGRVRPSANERVVRYLEFEVYSNMAQKELEKITNTAIKSWNIDKLLVHHREGKVDAGEIPVIIAVSASHRRDAIEACQYVINTLKTTVPIWKKEVFEGGEEWVSAHP
ncbi:MAG: molybdenum cofactor biosynthesis protein MoaE [Patescibacteria group bacterium]